jgi:Domain of unknown function (DUF6438)
MRKIACRIFVSIVTFVLGIACAHFALDDAAIPQLVPHNTRYISEIRFQRQGCADPSAECRTYDVTFYSDGTARYIGYEHSPDFLGSFHSEPNQFRFYRLVELIENERFFDMGAKYGKNFEEKQTLTVVTNEGIKSVTSYNWIDRPRGLWVISGMLDYEVFEIEWEQDSPTEVRHR